MQLTLGGANDLNLISTINNLNISGNVNIYSTSFSALGLGLGINNAAISLRAGTMSIGGQILAINTKGGLLPLAVAIPKFSIDNLSGTTTSAILQLSNTTPINTTSAVGSIDFYNNSGGTGTSTVQYTGSGQTVYTNTTTTCLDNTPTTYQNIGFAGAGTKTLQANDLQVFGNWNSSSSSGKVDAVTNSPNVIFQGTTQSLTDGGSDGGIGIVFKNVFFQGGGTKTITSGKFAVASTGLLTMAASTTLAAGGNLTLRSDASSSANVASMPPTASITGNVNVQRFFKGSSASLTMRGYRLISSPVYTGSVTSPATNVFDLSYLTNNAYVSGAGGATNGFNAPSGTNPSLYLYREDVVGTAVSFTSGNFKAITKINNSPVYNTGSLQRATITNTANDTIMPIPVGNGVLFFFRGNNTGGTTKTTQPFAFPEDVTFTQTGVLNSGTINVRLWYRLDNALPSTAITNPSPGNANIQGYCLVGNPYASTINWEKYNRSGSNSNIYGTGGVATTIWMYNPSNKQYGTYLRRTATITSSADTTTTVYTGTNNASNMIASGQGFFVRAVSTAGTLSFREGARTTAQPSATNLNLLMGLPKQFAVDPPRPEPSMRLKMVKDTINDDEVLINFDNNYAAEYDSNEDGIDIGGNGALVSLSVLSSDSVTLAINSLPLPQNAARIIPVAVNATASGTYELRLTELKNIPAVYSVWLKDKLTGDSANLRTNAIYSFAIDKADENSFGKNRLSIVISPDPALALKVVDIKASKTAAGALINWTTANAYNSSIFYLERSTDGGTSYSVLTTFASTNADDYSFTDYNPQIGVNQYRLRVKDLTNNITTTQPVSLKYEEPQIVSSNIMVYPNPTVNFVNVKLSKNEQAGSYTINLMSSSGHLVTTAVTSQASWQYNAGNLLPGTYIVRVLDNKTKQVIGRGKFVKQ
ncbi:hypothetical protein GCM10023149_17680 [Mucilaginibacter gynuensis]|uniref:Secretion system C-terminal sorting domain-containing protein n=1 Tax=Mucilaginibacter gynuensis TaxID=1302236 RepID=A0ABP8G821_9SPHI